VIQSYGASLEHGHRHVLQSLPRLLTLYFDYGQEVAGRKGQSSKERTAWTAVGGGMLLSGPSGGVHALARGCGCWLQDWCHVYI
jgi:hypothetical protein